MSQHRYFIFFMYFTHWDTFCPLPCGSLRVMDSLLSVSTSQLETPLKSRSTQHWQYRTLWSHILLYGHETWAIGERDKSGKKQAEMKSMRRGKIHVADTWRDYNTNSDIIYQNFKLNRRSQWPRGLRRRSTAACLLRLWVRIPLVGMDVCLLWLLCVVT